MKTALFAIFTVITGLLFYYLPIDIYVSNLFFNMHSGFFYKANSYLVFMHGLVYAIMTTMCATLGLIILYRFYRIRSFNYRDYLKPLYILLACLVGPGLIVNTLIKEHSTRPRPSQTIVFNGAEPYSPPFSLHGNCLTNCSFVSGHASVGFVFYAFAFVQNKPRRRRIFIWLGTFLGCIFGLGRIMQGAHYMSDIIFSGVTVFITCYLLAKIMKPEQDYTPAPTK